MVRVEERRAIAHGRVGIDDCKHQITHGASSSAAHLARDIGEGTQIIIDDGLAGNGEQLAVGGQFDAFRPFTDRAVLIFTAFGNLIQRIKRAHTHAAMLFEVRKIAGAGKAREDFLGFFIAAQHGFAGIILQNLRKV
jgi:hypothetical protein